MKTKKVTAKTASNLLAGIGLGVVISILITLIGAAGITQLVTTEKMTENNMGFAILGILLLAALVGAWTAVNQTKRLRLQVCLLEGAGYFLTLLAATALFFGGQYQGVLASGLRILMGSLIMAIFPSLGHKKLKVKNRAYR